MIRIAIAEDHNSLIDGIEVFFRFEKDISIVSKVNDGEALLELLNRQNLPIDVVVADIRMPKMDGIEVTKQITTNYPHTKVIAFTMFGQQIAVKKMMDAGAKGYLLKNAGLQTLLDAIRKVHNGEIYYDPNISFEDEEVIPDKQQEKLLSKRQNEILELVGKRLSNREIADRLFISVYTVGTHRKMIIEKLNLKGRNALLSYALNRKYDFD